MYYVIITTKSKHILHRHQIPSANYSTKKGVCTQARPGTVANIAHLKLLLAAKLFSDDGFPDDPRNILRNIIGWADPSDVNEIKPTRPESRIDEPNHLTV